MYDSMNRLVAEKDAAGAKTSYAYDKAGRLTGMTNANDGTTNYTYDANSNLTSITDSEGRSVRYAYELADRIIESAAGIGVLENRNTYHYDSVSNLISSTDGNGNTTEYSYNKLSQMVARKNGLGQEETYSYDLNARLEKSTRPDGDSITYDYQYTYDLSGFILTEQITANGTTKINVYGYDSAGQLTEAVTTDKKGDQLEQITYGYDGAGNKIAITRNAGMAKEAVAELKNNISMVTASGSFCQVKKKPHIPMIPKTV